MAEWQSVCKEADVPSGRVRVFSVGGTRIAMCRLESGEIYAVADVCTHDDGPLGEGELLDHAIECPRHGARFDIRTGRVLALPAVVPIQVYPVKLEGDSVLVEV